MGCVRSFSLRAQSWEKPFCTSGIHLARCVETVTEQLLVSRSRPTVRAVSTEAEEVGSDLTKPTLYERLGGADAIRAVVGLFYERVYNDERIKHWFDGVPQETQTGKLANFVCFATGGAEEYEVKDLGCPHAQLVSQGLGDEDYDVVVELFTDAMTVSWRGILELPGHRRGCR